MIAALILLSVMMAAAWLAQRLTTNASWADMFWSYAIGLAGLLAVLGTPSPRRFLVLAVIAVWSLRLGTAIALRSYGRREDPRYAKFRRDWGEKFQLRMFGLLQIQALAAWPLVFAIRAAAANQAPLGPADALAVLIAVVAIAGETLADRELSQFRRANPHGGVCDVGLWRWSRHPNYFFEFLGWWALVAFAAPFGWAMLVACLAPLSIYVLLLYISGIPPLEAHMLASRGDEFRAYQARTSAFFPWPPTQEQSR